MRKAKLLEWKIVGDEAEKPWLTHCIYESDNGDFAFYFSQIEEWSLMKYCSKLQIFKDKSDPRKIYDSKALWYLFNIFNETDFIFDWTYDGLVCFRRLINEGKNKYSYPYVIMNLTTESYILIDGQANKTEEQLKSLLNDDNIKWQPFYFEIF